MPVSWTPLIHAKFNLNTSGVAGFFGGEEAISAMGTIYLYRTRKWLGWYNSPGSYSVAKHYGQVATDRIWCALFPGVREGPSKLFGLDGTPGPEYMASQSGTRKLKGDTNHPAHIFMKEVVKKVKKTDVDDGPTDRNRPSSLTIVDLSKLDLVEDIDEGMLRQTSLIYAFLAISFNLGACIVCGVLQDWFCFVMILMGIVINGASCYAIGSAKLVFKKPKPSNASPPGDGILIDGPEVVILIGKEEVVGSLISGNLELKYSEPEGPGSGLDSKSKSKLNKHRLHLTAIGICSLFQYAQVLIQLLLVPQGTLFGQIMFLSTLAVSWMYNCYLSSLDKDNLQYELLQKVLGGPKIDRYELKTWTRMAVLALLILKPENPEKLLNRLLYNDTKPWRTWKREVLKKLKDENYTLTYEEIVNQNERNLLKDLCSDVDCAYTVYKRQKFDKAREVGHRVSSSFNSEGGKVNDDIPLQKSG